jgi:hypothetical protein
VRARARARARARDPAQSRVGDRLSSISGSGERRGCGPGCRLRGRVLRGRLLHLRAKLLRLGLLLVMCCMPRRCALEHRLFEDAALLLRRSGHASFVLGGFHVRRRWWCST